MPRRLRSGPKAVCTHTIANRIRAAGGRWQPKATKAEVSPADQRTRLAWCKGHEGTPASVWLRRVQAVADFKDFTWWPPKMAKKVLRYRVKYTYLWHGEKTKPGLTVPKVWFPRKEWQKSVKVKVYACVFSSGKSWATKMQKPVTSAASSGAT